MSKDEAREQIEEAIAGANPEAVTGGADGTSEYDVTEWEVCEIE